jgi:hypothetical protein
MTATASTDTPLHLKSFEVLSSPSVSLSSSRQLIPVVEKCSSSGWVMIRAFDPFHESLALENATEGNFLCLNTPRNNSNPDQSPVDEWVVQIRKDRDPLTDFR